MHKMTVVKQNKAFVAIVALNPDHQSKECLVSNPVQLVKKVKKKMARTACRNEA